MLSTSVAFFTLGNAVTQAFCLICRAGFQPAQLRGENVHVTSQATCLSYRRFVDDLYFVISDFDYWWLLGIWNLGFGRFDRQIACRAVSRINDFNDLTI